MKKTWLISMLLTLSAYCLSQQSDSVHIIGQVLSEDRIPEPGCIISVFHDEIGCISDVNGCFKLTVPIDGALRFAPISNQYYITICSFCSVDSEFNIKFILPYKSSKSKNSSIKIKGKTVKLEMDSLSDGFIACYNSNFQALTKKHVDFWSSLSFGIDVIIDGDYISEKELRELDYSRLKRILVIQNFAREKSVLFILTTKRKLFKHSP